MATHKGKILGDRQNSHLLWQLPLNINHFHTWTSVSTSVFLIPCHLHSCSLRQNSVFGYTSGNVVAFLCINISIVKSKI